MGDVIYLHSKEVQQHPIKELGNPDPPPEDSSYTGKPLCFQLLERQFGSKYRLELAENDCSSVVAHIFFLDHEGTYVADIAKYKCGVCDLTIGLGDTKPYGFKEAIVELRRHGLIYSLVDVARV